MCCLVFIDCIEYMAWSKAAAECWLRLRLDCLQTLACAIATQSTTMMTATMMESPCFDDEGDECWPTDILLEIDSSTTNWHLMVWLVSCLDDAVVAVVLGERFRFQCRRGYRFLFARTLQKIGLFKVCGVCLHYAICYQYVEQSLSLKIDVCFPLIFQDVKLNFINCQTIYQKQKKFDDQPGCVKRKPINKR